jgi:hypothetical protein
VGDGEAVEQFAVTTDHSLTQQLELRMVHQ